MIRNIFKLSPPTLALLLQLGSFAAVLGVFQFVPLKPTPLVLACLCGLVAAVLSYWAKLPRWWLIIQLVFVPAVTLTLSLEIQPGFFLVGFVLMLLVFWNTFSTRVPLYLSSQPVWRALEQLLPSPNPDRRFTFIDIGSGLGGVLTHLAKMRPDIDFTGIESAPLPFLWSWVRIHFGGYRHCRVQWGDFWQCDLSGYDVVYAYLSPAPMTQLWQKAKTEMQPGTVFISSTFSVPGQEPTAIITTEDRHHSRLLIWRM